MWPDVRGFFYSSYDSVKERIRVIGEARIKWTREEKNEVAVTRSKVEERTGAPGLWIAPLNTMQQLLCQKPTSKG
jgi:hypothetical protein